MEYNMYREIKNLFGNSCYLTEEECMLLHSYLELPQRSKTTSRTIEKENSKEQKVKFHNKDHYTLVEVKQSYSNNDWNSSELMVSPKEKSFSGNAYTPFGVYYFSMSTDKQLTIQFFDNVAMDYIRSLDDIELSAKNARLVLKLIKLLPDIEVTLEVDDIMSSFIAFSQDPEQYCEELISKNQTRKNQKST